MTDTTQTDSGGLPALSERLPQHQWRSVSLEFPVLIRPLAEGSVELALLIPAWAPLSLGSLERSGIDSLELVRRVAERVSQCLVTRDSLPRVGSHLPR